MKLSGKTLSEQRRVCHCFAEAVLYPDDGTASAKQWHMEHTRFPHTMYTHDIHARSPMKIAAVCCTYLRPRQLGRLIQCFLRQDYPAGRRELVILDDAGQYNDQRGDGWRLVSVDRRFPSLGEKRNAAAAMVSDDVDALAPWDDDDQYLPWALSASVAALELAPWSRPSVVPFSTARRQALAAQDGRVVARQLGLHARGLRPRGRLPGDQQRRGPGLGPAAGEGRDRTGRSDRAGVSPVLPLVVGRRPQQLAPLGPRPSRL